MPDARVQTAGDRTLRALRRLQEWCVSVSAQTNHQQLSLPEAWERDTRYVMAHDDRVVPARPLCAYCDKPAVDYGLCRRHALEYDEDLCGGEAL